MGRLCRTFEVDFVCPRGFRHGGSGTKLTVREAHGEDERRGKEDRKGSQTPDDPKGSADKHDGLS